MAGAVTGIKKCGIRGCGICEDILEVNFFYFRNSGVTFEIKTPMDCTVRNLIYVLQCTHQDILSDVYYIMFVYHTRWLAQLIRQLLVGLRGGGG